MKIKMDFVSNSSSTSFIYISDQEFTKENFLEAIGASNEGPLSGLFVAMFEELNSSIERGERIEDIAQASSSRDFDLTPEVLERVAIALKDGKPVIRGGLSSDGALAESILCMEMFEIDTDKMFINAYPSYW
ncbi:hypothetical protein HGP17_04395 [Rhizobium sp. P38BS-XIX]|uniref:hypothetical protein n=1 Tax=Rhizobium sp. P38BS-XIX TaxID=2726740 RepID=UPI00145768E3|nr:hypothetical protein [Rhizobium sp. P38BS-XIX]NLR96067.1 hypothetical protein [Rhizobium sp. P38BS-XIX]